MDSYLFVMIFASGVASTSQGKPYCWPATDGSAAKENSLQICLTDISDNVTVTCGEPLKLSCIFKTFNRTVDCAYWKKGHEKYPSETKHVDNRITECLLSIAATGREHGGKWTCGTKANDNQEGVLGNILVTVRSVEGSKCDTIGINNETQIGEKNPTAGQGAIFNPDISNGTMFISICVIAAVIILFAAIKMITCFMKRSKIRRSERRSKKSKSPTTSHHEYEEIDETNILSTIDTVERPHLPTQAVYQETALKVGIKEPLNSVDSNNRELHCHSYEEPVLASISVHGTAAQIQRNSINCQNVFASLSRNSCVAHDYHNI